MESRSAQGAVYFPALDGLRFVAFLLVFNGHTPVLLDWVVTRTVRSYGWLGVDLFLCLSAFLFTKLLYTEHVRTGRIRIFDFYVRRALRIWPLYFVFVGAMLIWTYSTIGWSPDLGLRAVGLLTFTDNLFAVFEHYSSVRSTSHLWTISFEEQFYAVIPWLLGFLFAVSRRRVLQLLGGFALFGACLRALAIQLQLPHPGIWTFPLTHFDSILAGLVIGLGLFDSVLRRAPRVLLGLLGLACLVGVMLLPNVSRIGWGLMLTYPLTGVGVGLILFYVMHSERSFVSKLLASAPLRYLGKISYGLYVYHILARDLFKGSLGAEAGTPLWMLEMVLLPLLATLMVSAVSYEVLEKPFLRMKERFALVKSRPV